MIEKLVNENKNHSSGRSLRVLFPIEPLTGIHLQWLGLMIISSVLKREGFEVEIIKADINEVRKKLRDGRKTLIGYSVPTYLAKFYLQFNKLVKDEFHVFSIFGGPHPTYFPEMIAVEGVDAICIGEGDYALLDLAKKLERDEPYFSVENLWIKEDSIIHKNPLRPVVNNLDDLPFPDRNLFSLYQPRSGLSPTGVMTTRGCPYSCTYCFNKAFRQLYSDSGKGNSTIRRRSVDNVIEELLELKSRYPATYFVFWDDIFVIYPDWLEDFTKKYKSKIGLPFNCNVRANLVNSENVKLLKEAGCFLVTMGLEAGNDYLRNTILKRNMTKDHIINAIELIKEEGIKVQTFNLIGIPKGSIETDFETLELNKRCKVDYAMCFIIQPYHRTELYNIAKEEGLLNQHFEGFDTMKNPYGYHPPVVRDPKQKLMTENLHRLFAFLVWLALPSALVKMIIKLPFARLYLLIYKFWFSLYRYFIFPPTKFHRCMLLVKNKFYHLFKKRRKI
ncbi:MAG: B12-binding domain-containing radical SAM protein [Candidatus Brocadiaceae bacterium]|nr:B12-binding domain-containing radical SAM protein [Candidatus Brocadiaceae bacterium]